MAEERFRCPPRSIQFLQTSKQAIPCTLQEKNTIQTTEKDFLEHEEKVDSSVEAETLVFGYLDIFVYKAKSWRHGLDLEAAEWATAVREPAMRDQHGSTEPRIWNAPLASLSFRLLIPHPSCL